MATATIKYDRVKYGERIDQLAQRLTGDPYRYAELLSANPNLDIWYPKVEQQVGVVNGKS